MWGKKRTDQIVALIEKRLEELNTWQGRLYRKKEFNSDPLIGGVRGG
jgi:radical SAM superfamily enzyme